MTVPMKPIEDTDLEKLKVAKSLIEEVIKSRNYETTVDSLLKNLTIQNKAGE